MIEVDGLLSQAERLQSVYLATGKAIIAVQTVEHALCHSLAVVNDIKVPRGVSLEGARSILAKHKANTLGTSIRIASQNSEYSSDLIDRLRWLKKERDWLVHNAFWDDGNKFLAEPGWSNFIRRTCGLAAASKSLQFEITSSLENFVLSRGIRKETLEDLAAQGGCRLDV